MKIIPHNPITTEGILEIISIKEEKKLLILDFFKISPKTIEREREKKKEIIIATIEVNNVPHKKGTTPYFSLTTFQSSVTKNFKPINFKTGKDSTKSTTNEATKKIGIIKEIKTKIKLKKLFLFFILI